MQLTFNSTYLSITSFPSISIPSFTLITGHNGAGKSHLLQGLMQGYIKADCAPNQNQGNQSEIRFFDWSTLVPQDTGYFSSEQIKAERASLFENFSNVRAGHNILEPLRSFARNNHFPDKYVSNPISIGKIKHSDLVDILKTSEAASYVRTQIDGILEEAERSMFSIWGDSNAKHSLKTLSITKKIPLVLLEEKEIASSFIPNWGETNIFQQSFARLFVAYRDMHLANQIALLKKNNGSLNANPISEEQFVIDHGLPPWEFVNQTLAEANLDFEINSPELDDYTSYNPQLRKKSSGTLIPFGNLSSGEKVLMSFAFCVYYANDKRQLSVYPKLLLLDEVDAPLHPSMSKNLISTITSTLVNKFGINVIATTHSPSTVAMAPEDSLYLMKSGNPGLHKSTTSEALNLLTVGVPTLAISYDGRRQVFVESPADAQTYDDLYKIVKPRLNSQRSLEFIATGTRSPSGQEKNTGCDVVKRLVTDLTSAGNRSVFGLLDWDGHHKPSERISVLAHGRRNGLENIIFDPLLIIALICKDCPIHKKDIGLPEDVGFIKISKYSRDEIQPIATRLVELVFEGPAKDIVTSKYAGGIQLSIDQRYFEIDDHELEGKLISTFPSLQSVTKQQAGKLMQHIIKSVLLDNPDFMPDEIEIVFKDLLERSSHTDLAN